MKAKILVTGGTGSIGAHLLYYLSIESDEITATKRPSSNIDRVKEVFLWHNPKEGHALFDKITWQDVDLLNRAEVLEAVEGKQIVFHLGAQVTFQVSDGHKLIQNNTDMTTFIVDACIDHGIDKLIHMSSIASLGKPNVKGIINEDCIWNAAKGKTAYSVSKFQSESEVWRGIEEGLRAVIVNPSVVIGPMMGQGSSGKLVSTIQKGWPFHSSGVTGYVDVRDVCEIMIKLMKSDVLSERFILNENNYSFQEIFAMIARHLGKKEPFIKFSRTLGLAVYYLLKPFVKVGLIKNSFSKSSINTFLAIRNYSNQKAVQTLNHNFIPIKDSMREMVQTHG